MIRFVLVLALVLPVSGCAVGGVDVWGGQRQFVDVQGYKFNVIYTDDRAEAYRVGPQFRPRAKQIFRAAREAMEIASGCKVEIDTLEGDVALVEADLAC